MERASLFLKWLVFAFFLGLLIVGFQNCQGGFEIRKIAEVIEGSSNADGSEASFSGVKDVMVPASGVTTDQAMIQWVDVSPTGNYTISYTTDGAGSLGSCDAPLGQQVAVNAGRNPSALLSNLKSSSRYDYLLCDGTIEAYRGWFQTARDKSLKAERLVSTDSAFAALMEDGSVQSWGNRLRGGHPGDKINKLRSGVTRLFSAPQLGFLALKEDGSAVYWGDPTRFEENSLTQIASFLEENQIVSVRASHTGFAVATEDHRIFSWYYNDGIFYQPSIGKAIKSIYSGYYGFVAVYEDGSVLPWNGLYETRSHDYSYENVKSQLQSGVDSIVGNSNAFAALKEDGSVVTWGPGVQGAVSESLAVELSSGVQKVVATKGAFAALKDGGKVVVWGNPRQGGQISEPAQRQFNEAGPIVDVVAGATDFVALTEAGSVIYWGEVADDERLSQSFSSVFYQVQEGITRVQWVGGHFVAFKDNGLVIPWGARFFAVYEDQRLFLNFGVQRVAGAKTSFVAINQQGQIMVFGEILPQFENPVIHNGRFKSVVGTRWSPYDESEYEAFAGILEDGQIVTWGSFEAGGRRDIPQRYSGVQSVEMGYSGPLYLRNDNSLVYDARDSVGRPATEWSLFTENQVQKFKKTAVGFALSEDGEVYHFNNEFRIRNSMVRKLSEGSPVVDILVPEGNLRSGVVYAVRKDGTARVLFRDLDVKGTFFEVAEAPSGKVVKKIVGDIFAIAVLFEDGSLVTIGNPSRGGGISEIDGQPIQGVKDVYRGSWGYARTSIVEFNDGSVRLIGNSDTGFDDVKEQLQAGIRYVASISDSYAIHAVVTNDGALVRWGANWLDRPADSNLQSGVLKVASGLGFRIPSVALKSDGYGYVFWDPTKDFEIVGLPGLADLSQQLLSGVADVFSARHGVVVMKKDGSMVSWWQTHGTDRIQFEGAETLPRNIEKVITINCGAYNECGFLGIDKNGGLHGWGEVDYTYGHPTDLKSGVVGVTHKAGLIEVVRSNGDIEVLGLDLPAGI